MSKFKNFLAEAFTMAYAPEYSVKSEVKMGNLIIDSIFANSEGLVIRWVDPETKEIMVVSNMSKMENKYYPKGKERMKSFLDYITENKSIRPEEIADIVNNAESVGIILCGLEGIDLMSYKLKYFSAFQDNLNYTFIMTSITEDVGLTNVSMNLQTLNQEGRTTIIMCVLFNDSVLDKYSNTELKDLNQTMRSGIKLLECDYLLIMEDEITA